MHDDNGCGFVGIGNSSSVQNLDISKVRAVMVMMIIVVKRIKSSRHEEVYGGQFRWAMSRQGRKLISYREVTDSNYEADEGR